MLTVLSFSRIFIYIVSIILLVITIRTKSKKICFNNYIVSILFILYFIFSIWILPMFLGIDSGMSIIFSIALALIDTIILMVIIIIAVTKIHNDQMIDDQSSRVFNYWILLILVPIIAVIMRLSYEIKALNDSDLVLNYNYQNGFIISEKTKYAVGENFCKRITISEKLRNSKSKYLDYYHYTIKYNQDGTLFMKSYDDPDFTQIDQKIVKDIFVYDGYKKNKSILKSYENSSKAVHGAYIIKVENI